MVRYREDGHGRLFRWDETLRAWFRVLSSDEEFEAAVRASRRPA